MSKRVLVNLNEITGDEGEYWAFVPEVLAPKPHKYKKILTFQERLAQKPKPKAFANPLSWGYGGGETPWPFDRKRAYADGRYRAGIRNAIRSSWVASNWRYEAQRQLARVIQDLADAEIEEIQSSF